MPKWSRRGSRRSRERPAFKVSWRDEWGVDHVRELESRKSVEFAKETFLKHGIILHVEVQ